MVYFGQRNDKDTSFCNLGQTLGFCGCPPYSPCPALRQPLMRKSAALQGDLFALG